MRTSFGWGRALGTLILLPLVALVVVLAFLWSMASLDPMSITIDGETVALSGVSGWHAALLVTALVVAVLLGLVIAALIVVFVLGVTAFGIVVAILATVTALAILSSPLLLIGWLIWRLVRPAPVPRAVAA
jgi:hypothetical protein